MKTGREAVNLHQTVYINLSAFLGSQQKSQLVLQGLTLTLPPRERSSCPKIGAKGSPVPIFFSLRSSKLFHRFPLAFLPLSWLWLRPLHVEAFKIYNNFNLVQRNIGIYATYLLKLNYRYTILFCTILPGLSWHILKAITVFPNYFLYYSIIFYNLSLRLAVFL